MTACLEFIISVMEVMIFYEWVLSGRISIVKWG